MKLKYGVVGGGNGGFIGGVHRRAAGFDDLAVLSAGCFSRSREENRETADRWDVAPARAYGNYKEMALEEGKRPDGIDFVCVATPNFTHYEICREFLENGIHVVCDKPLAVEVTQGEELSRLSKEKDLLFGVSYTYSGYPILQQARQMIKAGEIGKVVNVVAEYTEDFIIESAAVITEGRNSWLVSPEKTGKVGCTGHIATHAEYLLHYLTGFRLQGVLARFNTVITGLPLETEVYALLDYAEGAQGMIWSSLTAVGHQNNISIQIFGDQGSIAWRHSEAGVLQVAKLNQPRQTYDAARPYLNEHCRSMSRLPSGHPEGFYEAFANVYRGFCQDLMSRKNGETIEQYHFPTVDDGVNGLKFMEACYASNKSGNVWAAL